MLKVIIYGLGNKYFDNQQLLHEMFEVIGYSDKEENTKYKIVQSTKFIKLENLYHYCETVDKIIICGGETVKNSLYWTLKEKISWNDLILLDSLKKNIQQMSWNDYLTNMQYYNSLNVRKEFSLNKYSISPCLNDILENAGGLDSHYFLQDIWFAQKIYKASPEEHFDIGSRIDGFISHLLAMEQKVTLIDIRPLQISIKNLNFICADATNLTDIPNDSISSLSTLHAIEHFGLGRYGDTIDPEACFKVLQTFNRILKPGGMLYLSVPCQNHNELQFNAHRIFNPITIIKELYKFELLEFSYIHNYIITAVSLQNGNIPNEIIQNLPNYCCGMFIFEKRNS